MVTSLEPQPSRKPFRVLFQGDSITDAFRRPGEINPAYQLGNGYAFLAAAQLAIDHPGRFEFLNRGVSGDGLRELHARWEGDVVELNPDLLSVLVGVNGVIRHMKGERELHPAEFEALYRELIARFLHRHPGAGLLLVEPFLLPAGEVDGTWLRLLAPRREIVRRLAAETGAGFLAAHDLFEAAARRMPAAYWAYDGIHPTHAGFALLAKAWIEAAMPLLGLAEARAAGGRGVQPARTVAA